MRDPDRLTSHDKAFDRDTRGLIIRIIVVAFLAALPAADRVSKVGSPVSST
jgi:hypothetical protein